ncbi:MAG: hypothetical protein GQF41_1064 [Candidatus Rifleibacterium amylolyticum]|nr:MAG: hypothetical protein GQF41_1064 [Candidatus Rifleibacterium amylolyticum]
MITQGGEIRNYFGFEMYNYLTFARRRQQQQTEAGAKVCRLKARDTGRHELLTLQSFRERGRSLTIHRGAATAGACSYWR